MRSASKKVNGLGLCSGGLDSILAALVLKNQDIDVTWVSFETPFFGPKNAQKASEITGIPLIVKDITPAYLEMLKNPRGGYGKNMNPCMDCHTLMFKEAAKLMAQTNASFLFSGEVLGQRPMSQTKTSLRYVEKHSGLIGKILRPLSAKRLNETEIEKEGLVNREMLLSITGRGRKQQIQLAKDYGVTEYPAPAGGCLLTDKIFSNRLRDLFKHKKEMMEPSEFHLLKYGRHLRINAETKIIVGRTQIDNEHIMEYVDKTKDILIKVKNYPGPLVALINGGDKGMITLAASICAGYSKAPFDMPAHVEIMDKDKREVIEVLPLASKDTQHYMI